MRSNGRRCRATPARPPFADALRADGLDATFIADAIDWAERHAATLADERRAATAR